MSRERYHSALKGGQVVSASRVFSWSDGVNTAATWDMMAGEYPGERGDVYYADLPWERGYAEFNERAGATGAPTYDQFMKNADAMARSAAASGRPVFWIVGATVTRRYLTPDLTFPVTLNGGAATAACYGPVRVTATPGIDTVDLLRALAERHERVYDPCCGYGRAGRIFAEAGKRFTLTDYNAECIGVIAAEANSWGPKG